MLRSFLGVLGMLPSPSRAAALEALGELRAALRDYRDLHRSSPGVGNAGEAVKRIEKARAAQPRELIAPVLKPAPTLRRHSE